MTYSMPVFLIAFYYATYPITHLSLAPFKSMLAQSIAGFIVILLLISFLWLIVHALIFCFYLVKFKKTHKLVRNKKASI